MKPPNDRPRLRPGYAFASTRQNDPEPDIVVVGDAEVAAAVHVGHQIIDGTRCAAFRGEVCGQVRYFFQVALDTGTDPPSSPR